MTAVRISELRGHVGETVTVRGWVVTTRSSGKIAFLVLRDGTGTVQGVLSKKEVAEAAWAVFGALTQEASVAVTGVVRDDPRSPGGFELSVTSLEPLGPSPDYPISPKEHGTTFLFEHRHLWLRTRRQAAIARVRHEVEQAIRDYFYQEGFTLVDTPILTGAIGEEAGNLFATDYFDLGKAYLAQTGQLYVEAAAAALGKVYCFGPTFRAEKSKTRRHLTEFWMVEPEVAFNDSDANMRLQESFVSYIVARVLERRKEELAELERDTAPLERVQAPFPRISYTDAVARLNQLGSDIKWGDDLGGDDETLLAKEYDRPVFVFNYPKERQGVLHEGEPRRPAHGPQQRLPGARGLRRDHRRVAARGRLRQAARADPSSRGSIPRRTAGTWTCGSTAPSCTPASGSDSSGRWRGSAGIPHIREAIAFPRQIHRLYP